MKLRTKVVHKVDVVYGKKYGVTKAQAVKAYKKGFREGMKKDKDFWKDKRVIFK